MADSDYFGNKPLDAWTTQDYTDYWNEIGNDNGMQPDVWMAKRSDIVNQSMPTTTAGMVVADLGNGTLTGQFGGNYAAESEALYGPGGLSGLFNELKGWLMLVAAIMALWFLGPIFKRWFS